MSAPVKFRWNGGEFDSREDCERAIESEVAKFLCDGDAGSVELVPGPDVRCLNIRVKILES